MANLIKIGDDISSPDFTFDDDVIMSVNGHMSVNVISKELSADSFEATVEFDDTDRSLRSVGYSTRIYLYRDDTLTALFYFTSVKRVGKYQYTIYGTSFVGLLDKEPSCGGMYFGYPFKTTVCNLICADNLEKYNQLSNFTQKRNSSGYQSGVLISSDGYGESTLDCKVEATFIVNVITNRRYPVIGCSNAGTSGTSGEYGICFYDGYYMYLYYNGQMIQIIRNTSTYIETPLFVDITIDPGAGKCTGYYIKKYGTQYATRTEFEINISNAGSASVPLYVAGLGVNTSGQLHYSYQQSDIIYQKYRVYKPNGDMIIDMVAVKERPDMIGASANKLYVGNAVTGFIAEHQYGFSDNASVVYSKTPTLADTISAVGIKGVILDSITFDDTIASLPVYGWIPSGTKREALYQLLFATRVSIVRNGYDYLFSRLANDVVADISRGSIYDSGSASEKEDVRNIELVEHDFTAPDDEKKLFDNISSPEAANLSLIQFTNAPIYGTPTIDEVSGSFEIVAYNCNAAIVTGRGRIVGTPYIHGKKVIKRQLSGTVRGKTVSVENATMVTALNSEAVMERLAAYYDSAYKVSASFIYGNSEQNEDQQKCGNRYSFRDCFDEEQYGFLQSMGLTLSGKTKADGDFICGFVNPEDSDYAHRVVLSGSGSWDLPEGVEKIRVVLIGGGNGGDGGHAGQSGDYLRPLYEGNEWRSTVKAEGGNPGATGSPGKIYSVEITSPASSYTYSCGAGGIGGNGAGHDTTSPGGVGGDTTITGNGATYSSGSGEPVNTGWIDYFSGVRYAYKPPYWTNGAGKGGDGGYYVIDNQGNVTYYEATGTYNEIEGYHRYGGSNGTSIIENGIFIALGGCGGGATLATNPDGENGVSAWSNGRGVYFAGAGGNAGGHDVLARHYIPPKGFFGVGGIGGVGGGGGGAGGCVRPGYTWGASYTQAYGAAGGKGGDGGDGCIIIYY